MNKILGTHGRYRVRLEIMQNSAGLNPRTEQDCNLTNVITPTQQRYIDVDEDGGPLQYGWDYFAPRALDCLRRAGAEDLFIRWAKITHGATVIEDRPHDGAWAFWYLMPDKAAESTWPPEKIIQSEIDEYRAWADGEVYAYVIERSVRWVPEEGQEFEDGEPTPAPMTTWETVSSCDGYIGYDYAKDMAIEEFDAYKED